MSSSYDQSAKKWATQAEISASVSQSAATDALKAPVYADEAAAHATAAASSAETAQQSVTIASSSASSAADSANQAAATLSGAVKGGNTFTAGATLNSVLDQINDGTNLYYWTGTFPKVVAANSTVESSGGIAAGAWSVSGDGVLRSTLTDSTGSGTLGYALDNEYGYGTAGYKLNQFVDIRDFKDSNAEAGDWSSAIEAAIKYGVDNDIHEIYGKGNFYTSRTINIQGVPGSFKISIDKLGITDSFPNTVAGIFGTATDLIHLGNSGNLNGIEIYIGTLDGAYQSKVAGVAAFDVSAPRTPVANGIVYYGGGMSSSYITMGWLQNCVIGLLWGEQNSPNGTVFHKIGYVQYNYIGAYIRTALSGNSPIAEANVFDFRFCAQNYICGVWGGHGGQFTTLQNGNYDYNGRHCAKLRLSDTTGLTAIGGTSGLKLTNGTTQYDFLFRYQYQGYWYVFVASYDTALNYNSGNTFGWTTSDTITCTTVDGVAIKFDTVTVTEDDDSVSRVNYFDIFHDYQDDITSKWKIFVEYASGVYGGNMHLSNISFDTAINPYSHQWYGLGAITAGDYLSLYNYKNNNNPWLNVDSTKISIGSGMQLVTGLAPTLGAAGIVLLPQSSGVTDWVDAYTFANSGDFKLFEEGTHYYVKITSRLNEGSSAFHLIITSDGCSILVDFDIHLIAYQIIEVFGDDGTTVTGYKLQMRQEAQNSLYVTLNIERI